jgi:hypothetical protein
MKITNKTKGTTLADNAYLAADLFSRLKGLLGRKCLREGEALIIRPSNSIHTFFMRFAIDVLFVDRQNKIIAALKDILPWRVSPVYWNAYYVVELSRGVIEKTGTSAQDEIILS